MSFAADSGKAAWAHVAGAVAAVRHNWLPCLLAVLSFYLLAGLSQLHEYVRAIIFDFRGHLAPFCTSAILLFALVCSLSRACTLTATDKRTGETVIAIIALSPIAAIALATYLAASDVVGVRFLAQRQTAFIFAAALMLAVVVLLLVLRRSPVLRMGLRNFGTVASWLALAMLATAVLLPFGPPKAIVTFAQAFGPLGLVLALCVGIVGLATWLAGLSPSVRKMALLGPIAAAIVFSYFNWNANHTIRTLPTDAAIKNHNLNDLFAEWYNTRADRSQFEQYPVYVVATAGGGYYAAYHSALVLAHLQDQCDNFAQHVFAISGVSGGSLGAGVFSSLVRRLAPEQAAEKCQRSSGTRYADAVNAYFENDFLSPILFYSLGSDLLQRFLPFPIRSYDRALGLEHAIEQSWSDVDRRLGLRADDNPLRTAFTRSWSPSAVAPALILNTTRVDTGQRVLISPFRLLTTAPIWTEPATTVWQAGLQQDVSISTAIGLSARFPIISPAGEFMGAEFDWSLQQQPRRIGLVDGGYFENSGTATAMDLFYALEASIKENKLPVSLRLIVVGGIEGVFDELLGRMIYGKTARGALKQESNDFIRLAGELRAHVPRMNRSPTPRGELTSPISAVLGTRTDHGKQAIHRSWLSLIADSLERESGSANGNDDIVPLFGLSEANIPFPLSWVVSRPVRERIAARVSRTGCAQAPFQEMYEVQRRGRLAQDWRVRLLSDYGEDLRFDVELTRAACGIDALHRALSEQQER